MKQDTVEETEHPNIVRVNGKYIWRKDLFELWDDVSVISEDLFAELVEDYRNG